MAYSKVIVNSTTIMDVTQDTVTASNLFKNITATKADGTKATGTVETVAQATPVATIANATGIISATATQSAGVVVAGTKTGTAQLTVQAGTTITPTENTQVAVASYRWTTGTVTVAAISSTYVGSGVATKSSADIIKGVSGGYFKVTAPAGYYGDDGVVNIALYNAPTPSISLANATGIITTTANIANAGYYNTGSASASLTLTTQAGTTITPSETAQTAVASYRWTTGTVTVAAISSTYVGSGVTTRSSADLTADGATITAPAGYYSAAASKSVATVTQATPAATISNSTGIISATATQGAGYVSAGTKTGTAQLTVQAGKTVTPTATTQTAVASYRWTIGTVTVAAVPTDTNNTFSANGTYTPASGKWFDSVTVSVPSGAPLLQAKTVTYSPSETAQTATVSAGSGYDGLSQVTINVQAIPTTYVGSGITERTSLATNANTVTASAGYYPSAITYTVANGTAGTPVATKGSVSNYQISVTPTVTNTTGYITGGTKNGTAITVSASELVSGSLTVTENGTVDVTNLASIIVDVAGGGESGSSAQWKSTSRTLTSSGTSIQFTSLSGNPNSFIVFATSALATGAAPYKVAAVVYDGASHHGQIITNTSNAQVSYDDTSFSHTYSNGTLTVNSSGPYFQAMTYQLYYIYGGSSSDIGTANTQVGSGATSITFTGVSERPDIWYVIFKSNFGTSSGYQRVIFNAYNSTNNISGMEMDSSAQYDTGDWSWSYNNGSLTVQSSGTNAGGYFHQPGYYQLTYLKSSGGGSSGGAYQTKTITPTTATQTILPDTGYDALSQVTVNPIPSNYIIPSGTITITQNSTNINVSQYATASVNVAGKNVQIASGVGRVNTTTYTAVSGQSLTVAKTGTYNIYWCGYRSSTSGTSGSQLYIGNSAYGNASTTFDSTYTNWQIIHLSGVSLTASQTIEVRARARNTSSYMYIANLTIIEQ